ncbi:MAG: hypothetical protein ACR2M6_02480 [Vampirovibrionia bacterium]
MPTYFHTLKNVYCTFTFEGKHCWPDAYKYEGIEFLSLKHRHMFHAKVIVSVNHNDRDVEFILMKRYLQEYVGNLPKDLHSSSCEMLAHCIGVATHCFINGLTIDQMFYQFPSQRTPWDIDYDKLSYLNSSNVIQVKVSEDGENGAIILMSNKEVEVEDMS